MTRFGFFTAIFNQFVALLSALCIINVPSPAPNFVAPDSDPPAAVAAAPVPREPGFRRVIDTQILIGIEIGRSLAASADRGTFAVLAIPSDLAEAMDRGGVAALPAGIAQSGRRLVRAAEESATDLVRVLSDAVLAELALLPGARPPDRAAAAAPIDGVPRVEVPALIAQVADVARQLVAVVRDGAIAVITVVSDVAQAALSLIPGGQDAPRAQFVEQPRPGAGLVMRVVETVIRLPLAVGVAAADLAVAGLQAGATMTGAIATATTDVVRAAVNPRSEETVAQAVSRAPATVFNGARDAAEQLQLGITRAATDFRRTLNPRAAETRVSATGGLNTTVNGSEVVTTTGEQLAASSDAEDNGNQGVSANATLGDPVTVSNTTTTPGTGTANAEAGTPSE